MIPYRPSPDGHHRCYSVSREIGKRFTLLRQTGDVDLAARRRRSRRKSPAAALKDHESEGFPGSGRFGDRQESRGGHRRHPFRTRRQAWRRRRRPVRSPGLSRQPDSRQRRRPAPIRHGWFSRALQRIASIPAREKSRPASRRSPCPRQRRPGEDGPAPDQAGRRGGLPGARSSGCDDRGGLSRALGAVLGQPLHGLGGQSWRPRRSLVPSKPRPSGLTFSASSKTCWWPRRAIRPCCFISIRPSPSARTPWPPSCRPERTARPASTKIWPARSWNCTPWALTPVIASPTSPSSPGR